MDDTDPPTVGSAATALAEADKLRATVQQSSRWLIRFHLAYGAAAAVAVLLLGLVSSPAGIMTVTACWLVVIAALIGYAVRQPVSHRGMARTHGFMIAGWTVTYMAVLIPGVNWFEGDLMWWLPGAAVVAVPSLLSAYVTARHQLRPRSAD
ncbi:hypothetical protein GCM10010191_67140 [Actinomadura vinacea]|uniref:Uncharacterized protein n=1 Tax=Actinomadura vinacea TaxID=115336 RepID=A0ABP5X094_9ACTN